MDNYLPIIDEEEFLLLDDYDLDEILSNEELKVDSLFRLKSEIAILEMDNIGCWEE